MRSKTVGGSCLTWLAIVLTSLAFFASLATIASCEYVRHENDDPNVADAEMTTAGIYCFDSSVFDSWSQLGSTSVRIFVQVVAAIATFLGLVMVIMLWKITRKPHGKCYHRTMGFFIFLCFTCMFLTLTLQLDEFCLDYEGLSHNCDLGWGGYAAIAAGALYFLAAIALCKMPMYKETPVESDEPDEVVTKEEGVEADTEGVKEDKIADEEAPEEAPAQ